MRNYFNIANFTFKTFIFERDSLIQSNPSCCEERLHDAGRFYHNMRVTMNFIQERRHHINVCVLVWRLTCLQSAASRFRLLVDTVRLIVIPANWRLLFPKMEERQREEGWRETETDSIIYTTHQIKKVQLKISWQDDEN